MTRTALFWAAWTCSSHRTAVMMFCTGLLVVGGCSRPVARSCASNHECGAANACVAQRCESNVGLPVIQKDERLVVQGEVTRIGPRAGAASELYDGEEIEITFSWPTDDKVVHESFLILRLATAVASTLELSAVRPRDPSSQAAASRDHIVFARAKISPGDEVVRLDLSRLPGLSRKEHGRYRVALRSRGGRGASRLRERAEGPEIEWYFGRP